MNTTQNISIDDLSMLISSQEDEALGFARIEAANLFHLPFPEFKQAMLRKEGVAGLADSDNLINRLYSERSLCGNPANAGEEF